jgi:hypothetical protein
MTVSAIDGRPVLFASAAEHMLKQQQTSGGWTVPPDPRVLETALTAEADLVLVVDSRNSSNSQRLVGVALGAGADAAHRVDDAEAVDAAGLRKPCWPGTASPRSRP